MNRGSGNAKCQNTFTTAFAKTTRPELGNIVPRDALFTRLDGSAERTVGWIFGPGGAGKSTLAASYVEARGFPSAWYQIDPDDADIAAFFHYLSHAARRILQPEASLPSFDTLRADNIAAYARRYFRQLFAQATVHSVLVLDNLNDVPLDSTLYTVLDAGLQQIPRGCCVLITSREPPPASMARLRTGGNMVTIDAEDLRISASEIGLIGALRGMPVDAAAASLLHERTLGWVAAVVLMIEHAKITNQLPDLPDDAAPSLVFDYLAGEVFIRFEPATQNFLLSIAFLPRIATAVAEGISGDANAGRLLLNLAHNDYFVREMVANGERIFQLHPLMRAFLLHRAAEIMPDAIGRDAKLRAATLMRRAGQSEDAVSLLIGAHCWTEVALIAAELAPDLLAEGRRETLVGWLERLPPEILSTRPLLLQTLADCFLHSSPRRARQHYERAHNSFRAHSNQAGMMRTAAGVIDSIILEFDDLGVLDGWVESLLALTQLHAVSDGDPKVSSSLVRAILLRDPASPALRDLLAAAATPNPMTRDAQPSLLQSDMARAVCALLQGDFSLADTLRGGIVAEGRDPATRIAVALLAALHRFLDGEFQSAWDIASDGVAISDAEGIHAFDGWLHTMLGIAALGLADRARAQDEMQLLEALPLRRGDRAILHYLRGWLAANDADAVVAQREMKSCLMLAAEAGIPWIEWFARIAMTQVFGVGGNRVDAAAQIRVATALAERLASPILRVSTQLADAITTAESPDDAAALDNIRRAFATGRIHGFRHVVGLMPFLVADLCATALKHNIEVDFTRGLIRSGKLSPPSSALRLRQWPWPFQIETLGGFALLRGNEPIEFSSKGPGRPVELLKVLLAMSGQNVRVDQLADALWPRVDADYAHKSFTATLHRLRQIFRDDETLSLRDGRLSLNAAIFRVDVQVLEQWLAECEEDFRQAGLPAGLDGLRETLDDLLTAYRGPFLPDEVEQPAYIACREQLRARVARVVSRLARQWETAGHPEAASDAYLRLIDADISCETFYRALMLCYQRQGERGEALATYERLFNMLAARFKSQPAMETQAIYASLNA